MIALMTQAPITIRSASTHCEVGQGVLQPSVDVKHDPLKCSLYNTHPTYTINRGRNVSHSLDLCINAKHCPPPIYLSIPLRSPFDCPKVGITIHFRSSLYCYPTFSSMFLFISVSGYLKFAKKNGGCAILGLWLKRITLDRALCLILPAKNTIRIGSILSKIFLFRTIPCTTRLIVSRLRLSVCRSRWNLRQTPSALRNTLRCSIVLQPLCSSSMTRRT